MSKKKSADKAVDCVHSSSAADDFGKNAEHWTKAEHHNPGTPDDDVSHARVAGRQACRHGFSSDSNPYPQGTPGGLRVQWYLGWYDVGLAKWYGNKDGQKAKA